MSETEEWEHSESIKFKIDIDDIAAYLEKTQNDEILI